MPAESKNDEGGETSHFAQPIETFSQHVTYQIEKQKSPKQQNDFDNINKQAVKAIADAKAKPIPAVPSSRSVINCIEAPTPAFRLQEQEVITA